MTHGCIDPVSLLSLLPKQEVLETRRDDKIKLLEIALQGLIRSGSSSRRPAFIYILLK